jgi:oligopeptidase B
MKNIKKTPFIRKFHNDEFVDNYEWLRDKEDSEVIEFLNDQNAATEDALAPQSDLRSTLFDEIKQRVKENDMSVPSRSGKYWYYARTVEGLNYALSCRLPIIDQNDWIPPKIPEDQNEVDPNEQIFFDPNAEAKRLGADFYSLGGADVSEDGNLLVYSYDAAGDERYCLKVRDLKAQFDAGAGAEAGFEFELDDVLEDVAPGAFFSLDQKYIFYTRFDDSWRSFQVWRHQVGDSDSNKDVLIFQEDDEHFNCGIELSLDKKLLMITSGSKITDELWILEADTPTGDFRLFKERKHGVEFSVDFWSEFGYYFVTHNQDSEDFDIDLYSFNGEPFDEQYIGRFLSSDLGDSKTRKINGISCFGNFLLISVRCDVLVRTYIIMRSDFEKDPLHPEEFWQEIKPDGLEIYSAGAGADEYDSPVYRWSYSSYTNPGRLFLYDTRDGSEQLLKEAEVLPLNEVPFNSGDYCERRLWVTSTDRVRIPLSLIWRCTPRLNDARSSSMSDDSEVPQNRPCLIYGYGSYGASMNPGFSVPRLSLLDRGMVYAVAHVRGGSEMGRSWYNNGKELKKMNTFTDFNDCARFLIEQGITTANHLVANGGSAGGLLMGAILNLEPELYKAIEADVPFVDPLTSILKPELPLTVPEWEEWGNPLESEEVYTYMKAYSPYENIRPAGDFKSTPAVLATTSLNDTRVLYVEPAKWVAKLQENGYNALLKCEMDAGHGGVSGRYKAWEQVSFENAWLLSQVLSG